VNEIGAAADELMAVFAVAHELFVERFRGVSVSIPIADERFASIGFGNHRDGFTVHRGELAHPLSDVSLALRVRLVAHISDLWDACEIQAAHRVIDIGYATSKLRAFIASKEQL
jgi:hypothetical protein